MSICKGHFKTYLIQYLKTDGDILVFLKKIKEKFNEITVEDEDNKLFRDNIYSYISTVIDQNIKLDNDNSIQIKKIMKDNPIILKGTIEELKKEINSQELNSQIEELNITETFNYLDTKTNNKNNNNKKNNKKNNDKNTPWRGGMKTVKVTIMPLFIIIFLKIYRIGQDILSDISSGNLDIATKQELADFAREKLGKDGVDETIIDIIGNQTNQFQLDKFFTFSIPVPDIFST